MPRAVRALALSMAVAVAGLFVGVGLAAHSAAAPVYTCSGKQITLFDDSNGFAVGDGGAAPVFSTNGKAYCVTYIQTYHWNSGKGALPGTLGLKRVGGAGPGVAATIGPFKAKSSAGQNSAPNVNWYVGVPPIPANAAINGDYSCTDSGAGTWSSNTQSGGRGFCIVYAVPAVPSCKCTEIKTAISPSLFTKPALRTDEQSFGVSFKWTMGCTQGKGGCTGTIKFAPPTIQAGLLPPTKSNLKLDIHSATFTCAANCGATISGTAAIKLKSPGQLNDLFGRTLAFTLTTECNGQSRRQVVKVFVDQHGKFAKHP
jgi:hypothetical protein